MVTSHPYIIITRKIKENEQQITEIKKYLYLYHDCVISDTDKFLLKDVFDMSYRSLSNDSGFLYLHTSKGVFSYHTKIKPHHFIHTYLKLRSLYR